MTLEREVTQHDVCPSERGSSSKRQWGQGPKPTCALHTASLLHHAAKEEGREAPTGTLLRGHRWWGGMGLLVYIACLLCTYGGAGAGGLQRGPDYLRDECDECKPAHAYLIPKIHKPVLKQTPAQEQGDYIEGPAPLTPSNTTDSSPTLKHAPHAFPSFFFWPGSPRLMNSGVSGQLPASGPHTHPEAVKLMGVVAMPCAVWRSTATARPGLVAMLSAPGRA